MVAHTVDTTARVAALRALMRNAADGSAVNAYVVPSEDQRAFKLVICRTIARPLITSPDFSEYSAKCDERRAFISGFNGSAGAFCHFYFASRQLMHSSGCAVVTENDAYLFTDGRYFLQAEQQLDR
jgi:Xaa-Pro aminopeptidase